MGKTNLGKSAKQEARTGFQVSQDPVVQGKSELDVHKFELTREERQPPAFDDLGELPRSYGEETLYLVARDPHWLFTYWDVDWSRFPAAAMQGGEFKIWLKLFVSGQGEESLIEINPEARNWYIPVSRASTAYYAEIGF